jgi:redox-sensitive bicupin YhaK (pirin superfamily)
MIELRRGDDRHHIQRGKRDEWLTFYLMDRSDPLAEGFGALAVLNERRLAPGASSPLEPCHDAEIVTYVREGTVAHTDSAGHSGVLLAGEFLRRTGTAGIQRSEANASRSDWAHVFHIWLRPAQVERDPKHEQQRFSTAERRGVLRVIASPDGRKGSLRVHQDTEIYSALLDPGQHLVHELLVGRRAWLHVVCGEVTLGDLALRTGDGLGLTAERSVSVTAHEDTEIFLIDLCGSASTPRASEQPA